MITAIEIENFKGIGERQRVELRPITLLFGPNSAGKSTILHAIHYAREVLERRNLDADHTVGGGPFVDLGGFRSFVHNRAPGEPVTIAFDLRQDAPSRLFIPQIGQWQAYESLVGFGDDSGYGDGTGSGAGSADGGGNADGTGSGAGSAGCITSVGVMGSDGSHGNLGSVPSRIDTATTARVEISVRWSPYLNRPFVSRYRIWIDGHSIGVIESDVDKDRPRLTGLNLNHPLFAPNPEGDIPVGAEAIAQLWHESSQVLPGDEPNRAWPLIGTSAMPDFDDELVFEQAETAKSDEPLDPTRALAAMNLLSRMLVGPGQLLRDELCALRYIGPLRQTPSRNFEPPLTPDPERWATGLAAWDLLKIADDQLVAEVSEWLLDDEKLATGYSLRRQRYAELDLASPLAIQLTSPRAVDDIEDLPAQIAALPRRTRLTLVDKDNPRLCVEPDDVGEGVAQIVPVVVAALDRRCRLLAIEQPELHVHPRMQVALGDLFIHRVTVADRVESMSQVPRRSGFSLLETHSEHLLLRILRRVREAARTGSSGDRSISSDDIAIYYVSHREGTTQASPISIDTTGELRCPWPDDQFEIDFHERFA